MVRDIHLFIQNEKTSKVKNPLSSPLSLHLPHVLSNISLFKPRLYIFLIQWDSKQFSKICTLVFM